MDVIQGRGRATVQMRLSLQMRLPGWAAVTEDVPGWETGDRAVGGFLPPRAPSASPSQAPVALFTWSGVNELKPQAARAGVD